MANYKDLLGDKYQEGMDAKDVLALLESINLANLGDGSYVAKGKLDEKTQKIAEMQKLLDSYKEKENANLTDAQKKELEFQKLMESNTRLEKEISRFKERELILNSGFNNDECTKIFNAQDNNENVYQVYADIMQDRIKNELSSQKASQMKNMPKAPQGNYLENDVKDVKSDAVSMAERLAKANSPNNQTLDAIKNDYLNN
jgi:hypothetical protein